MPDRNPTIRNSVCCHGSRMLGAVRKCVLPVEYQEYEAVFAVSRMLGAGRQCVAVSRLLIALVMQVGICKNEYSTVKNSRMLGERRQGAASRRLGGEQKA